jgi:hypothetical protein
VALVIFVCGEHSHRSNILNDSGERVALTIRPHNVNTARLVHQKIVLIYGDMDRSMWGKHPIQNRGEDGCHSLSSGRCQRLQSRMADINTISSIFLFVAEV